MQPSCTYPEGYWENTHFVKLNDRIRLNSVVVEQAALLPAHWEFAPEVDSLFEEAEALVGRFRDHNVGLERSA